LVEFATNLPQRTKEDTKELEAILKKLALVCNQKEVGNQDQASSSTGLTLSPNRSSTLALTKKNPVDTTDNRKNQKTSCDASPQGTSSLNLDELKWKGKGKSEDKEDGEETEG
jgi:hypothetical protein